jgi:hypothetical protein
MPEYKDIYDYVANLRLSNEQDTYHLGVAVGYFQMLDALKTYIDKEIYEQILIEFNKLDDDIWDHFKKLNAINKGEYKSEIISEKPKKFEIDIDQE